MRSLPTIYATYFLTDSWSEPFGQAQWNASIYWGFDHISPLFRFPLMLLSNQCSFGIQIKCAFNLNLNYFYSTQVCMYICNQVNERNE